MTKFILLLIVGVQITDSFNCWVSKFLLLLIVGVQITDSFYSWMSNFFLSLIVAVQITDSFNCWLSRRARYLETIFTILIINNVSNSRCCHDCFCHLGYASVCSSRLWTKHGIGYRETLIYIRIIMCQYAMFELHN